MNETLFDPLEPPHHTTASHHTCRDCGARIRHAWTPEPMSIRVTVDAEPTTRQAALLAIVTGGTAYAKQTSKTTTVWHPLDRWTIGSDRLERLPHHTGHRCGHTPPPAPPKDTRRPPTPTPY